MSVFILIMQRKTSKNKVSKNRSKKNAMVLVSKKKKHIPQHILMKKLQKIMFNNRNLRSNMYTLQQNHKLLMSNMRQQKGGLLINNGTVNGDYDMAIPGRFNVPYVGTNSKYYYGRYNGKKNADDKPIYDGLPQYNSDGINFHIGKYGQQLSYTDDNTKHCQVRNTKNIDTHHDEIILPKANDPNGIFYTLVTNQPIYQFCSGKLKKLPGNIIKACYEEVYSPQVITPADVKNRKYICEIVDVFSYLCVIPGVNSILDSAGVRRYDDAGIKGIKKIETIYGKGKSILEKMKNKVKRIFTHLSNSSTRNATKKQILPPYCRHPDLGPNFLLSGFFSHDLLLCKYFLYKQINLNFTYETVSINDVRPWLLQNTNNNPTLDFVQTGLIPDHYYKLVALYVFKCVWDIILINIKQEFLYRNFECHEDIKDIQNLNSIKINELFEYAYQFLMKLNFVDISNDGREVLAIHPDYHGAGAGADPIKFSVSQAALVNIINPAGVGKPRSDGNAESRNFALYILRALENYFIQVPPPDTSHIDYVATTNAIRIFISRIFKYSGDTSHLIYALLVRSAFMTTKVNMENVSISIYLSEMPLSYRTMLLYNDPDLLGEGGISLFINKLEQYESLVTFKNDPDYEYNPDETDIYALTNESWVNIFENEINSLKKFQKELVELMMPDYLYYDSTYKFVSGSLQSEGNNICKALLLHAAITQVVNEVDIQEEVSIQQPVNVIDDEEFKELLNQIRRGELNLQLLQRAKQNAIQKLQTAEQPVVLDSLNYVINIAKDALQHAQNTEQIGQTEEVQQAVQVAKQALQSANVKIKMQDEQARKIKALKQEIAKISFEILKFERDTMKQNVTIRSEYIQDFMKEITGVDGLSCDSKTNQKDPEELSNASNESPNAPIELPNVPENYVFISSSNKEMIISFYNSVCTQMEALFGGYPSESQEFVNCKINEKFLYILRSFSEAITNATNSQAKLIYNYLFWRYYDMRRHIYEEYIKLQTQGVVLFAGQDVTFINAIYNCKHILKRIKETFLDGVESVSDNIIKTQEGKKFIHDLTIAGIPNEGIPQLHEVNNSFINIPSGLTYNDKYKLAGELSQKISIKTGMFSTKRKKGGDDTPFTKLSSLKVDFTSLINKIKTTLSGWGLSDDYTDKSKEDKSKENLKDLLDSACQCLGNESIDPPPTLVNINEEMNYFNKYMAIKKQMISIDCKLTELKTNIETEGKKENLFTARAPRKTTADTNGILVFTEKYLYHHEKDINMLSGIISLIENLESLKGDVTNQYRIQLKGLMIQKLTNNTTDAITDNFLFNGTNRSIFSWLLLKHHGNISGAAAAAATDQFTSGNVWENVSDELTSFITQSSTYKESDKTTTLLSKFISIYEFFNKVPPNKVPPIQIGGGFPASLQNTPVMSLHPPQPQTPPPRLQSTTSGGPPVPPLTPENQLNTPPPPKRGRRVPTIPSSTPNDCSAIWRPAIQNGYKNRFSNAHEPVDEYQIEQEYFEKSYLTCLFYQAYVNIGNEANNPDKPFGLYNFQTYTYYKLLKMMYEPYCTRMIYNINESNSILEKELFINLFLALLSPCQRYAYINSLLVPGKITMIEHSNPKHSLTTHDPTSEYIDKNYPIYVRCNIIYVYCENGTFDPIIKHISIQNMSELLEEIKNDLTDFFTIEDIDDLFSTITNDYNPFYFFLKSTIPTITLFSVPSSTITELNDWVNSYLLNDHYTAETSDLTVRVLGPNETPKRKR
jgi:hypothetical protein